MPSSRTVRGTNSSDERTQTGRPIAVATSRRGGKRPRNTDSAGTAKTLPRMIMPGARYVPSSTGNTARKPGREPSSGGRRIPDRPGSSEDNRPDTGRGSSSPHVSGVNRGTFYVEGLRGNPEDGKRPVSGDVGDMQGNPLFVICPPAGSGPARSLQFREARAFLPTLCFWANDGRPARSHYSGAAELSQEHMYSVIQLSPASNAGLCRMLMGSTRSQTGTYSFGIRQAALHPAVTGSFKPMTRRRDGHPIHADGNLLHGRPEGLRTGYLECRDHHPVHREAGTGSHGQREERQGSGGVRGVVPAPLGGPDAQPRVSREESIALGYAPAIPDD